MDGGEVDGEPGAAAEEVRGASVGEMSLSEHLTELRDRLVRSLIALAVGTVVGYMVFPPVFEVLVEPYCSLSTAFRPSGEECRLVVTTVLEPFSVRIKLSLVIGLIVGGPVIFYQLWRFITPGLLEHERRYALPFVVLSQLMFMGGVAFAYMILPFALEVLLAIAGDAVTPLITAQEYLSFMLTSAVAFGVLFEVPLILSFLALAGVVSAATLRRFRAHAIVGNFLLAAVLTPTPDPVTMSILAIPMVLLYEGAIGVAWFVERRRRKQVV